MIEVVRYTKSNKGEWDGFCRASLNGVFLFLRDYMDYHSDRFRDHSLMFYRERRLVALLPCNETQEDTVRILSSHDGLTFGSFIMGVHTHQTDMLECVEALIGYCSAEGISQVLFKPVPLLLQRYPSEQDVYALIRSGAELFMSEPSTVTRVRGYEPNYGEKRYCGCAEHSNLSFMLCEGDDFWEQYHNLLSYVLDKYHDAKPVHSMSELLMLHHRFPENMRLFGVFDGEEMLAGTVVYEYNNAVHTQYMASNESGRNTGALHYSIQKVIEYYGDKEWLDFGISTENGGEVLNGGLARFKEGFRGNTLLYNSWRLRIK